MTGLPNLAHVHCDVAQVDIVSVQLKLISAESWERQRREIQGEFDETEAVRHRYGFRFQTANLLALIRVHYIYPKDVLAFRVSQSCVEADGHHHRQSVPTQLAKDTNHRLLARSRLDNDPIADEDCDNGRDRLHFARVYTVSITKTTAPLFISVAQGTSLRGESQTDLAEDKGERRRFLTGPGLRAGRRSTSAARTRAISRRLLRLLPPTLTRSQEPQEAGLLLTLAPQSPHPSSPSSGLSWQFQDPDDLIRESALGLPAVGARRLVSSRTTPRHGLHVRLKSRSALLARERNYNVVHACNTTPFGGPILASGCTSAPRTRLQALGDTPAPVSGPPRPLERLGVGSPDLARQTYRTPSSAHGAARNVPHLARKLWQ